MTLPALAAPQNQQVTIDRVVASLDAAAITQADVEHEYRLEAFLDRANVPDRAPDAHTFDRVLNRLIDQRVLARELEAEGLSTLDVRTAVDERLSALGKNFPSDAAFRAALRRLGMNQQELTARLEEQQRILEMIDKRLRPQAQPSASEVESYYHGTFVPELARRGNTSPPSLSQVADQIVEVLVQKKISELLETWLKELRSSHRIIVLTSGPEAPIRAHGSRSRVRDERL